MSPATPLDSTQTPNPSAIRARILEDHERLRHLLDRVELLATRMLLKKEPESAPLRELGLELCERLRLHMEYELELLRPALLEADPWGEERVAVLEADHELQLSQLCAVEERLRDESEHPYVLGLLVLGFLVRMRDDMEDEERLMLSEEVLHDGLATDIEPE